MRFFIDAQLPHQIKYAFVDIGHEALHANELPAGMKTSDAEILETLPIEVVIVSKDDDFYQSALIHGRPIKLIYVTMGNQSRKVMVATFRKAAVRLVELLGQYDLLEIDTNGIIGIR
ncbi:MAG: DUF5615 family PIN-like protein [Bacteroidota bacterium]